YTFSGVPGQRLFLDIPSNQYTFGFTILRPDGSVLLPARTFSPAPIVLDSTGTYTVVASHSPYGSFLTTGPYQFTLWQIPADVTQQIPLDAPVSGEVQTPGQTITYHFQGTAGQQLLLDIKNNPAGLPFQLLTPSGSIIQVQGDYGITNWF